jgi:signal transduction histidine kinase
MSPDQTLAAPASAITQAAPAHGQTLYGQLERLAMVAGALVMLAIVGASVLIAARTDRDLTDAERAQTTRSLAVDLLESVISAETGQRGFLLTGRPDYLIAYNQAVPEIPRLLAALDASLAPASRTPFWRAPLGAAITDKMAELEQTVRLEKAGRHAEALALVQTDRGQRDMQQARALANQLSLEQRAAVASDLHRSQAGTHLLVIVDATALALLVVLVAFVGHRLGQSVRALAGSEAALREANAELQQGSARLEAAVAERTFELTNANAEIQRFAYIVSHDLRAPLLNIIGFTSELQNATNRLNRFVSENLEPTGIDVPPEVREASQVDLPEAIKFIQTSTTKMDRLITAILRLSREGRRVLSPEKLDMTALISGIADTVRHQADAAGATITVQALPPLTCDRTAIEQIFSNVIENALKYLSPHRAGEITIHGRRQGSNLIYEVRDNGRGVSERDRDRIFELFRRAGTQDIPGEGIGLAHVRALLRRLGGTIECESVLDQGSNFIVTLPALPLHHGAHSE